MVLQRADVFVITGGKVELVFTGVFDAGLLSTGVLIITFSIIDAAALFCSVTHTHAVGAAIVEGAWVLIVAG